MVTAPTTPDNTAPLPAATTSWTALMPLALSAAEHECLRILQALGSPTQEEFFAALFGPDDDKDFDEKVLDALENRGLIAIRRRAGGLVYALSDTGQLWWARRENGTGDYNVPAGVLSLFDALDREQQHEVAEYAASRIDMELHPEGDGTEDAP